MVTIEFLEDENGVQQVVEKINEIAIRGQNEKDYAEISHRIAQVLDYLSEVGVPPDEGDSRTYIGESLEGNIITLKEIVKELTRHYPLLECKVNWIPVGAFRAIFFYIEDQEGNHWIYFTQAVIKPATYSEEFEAAIQKSEEIMNRFLEEK